MLKLKFLYVNRDRIKYDTDTRNHFTTCQKLQETLSLAMPIVGAWW